MVGCRDGGEKEEFVHAEWVSSGWFCLGLGVGYLRIGDIVLPPTGLN